MRDLNFTLKEISKAIVEEYKEEFAESEEVDEKMNYFFNEILECFDFLRIVANEMEQEKHEFAPKGMMELLLELGEFYEDCHEKYNGNQLAFQFAKRKGFLNSYKLFKKAEKDGVIGRKSKLA